MTTRKFSAPIWTRRLHLHLGLFISPFILVYAISTIFLNHGIRGNPSDSEARIVPVDVSADTSGPELVSAVLGQLGISGEVLGNGAVRDGKTTIRVARPGVTKIITVNVETQETSTVTRTTGLLGAITFLHFNPGLHKPPNSFVAKSWGVLADSTVYITLFLTISGVYLWLLFKSERRAGWIAAGLGALTFTGLLIALLTP